MNHIKDFGARFNNNHGVGNSQLVLNTFKEFQFKDSTMFPIQGKNPFGEHLNISKFKEPKINLLKRLMICGESFEGFSIKSNLFFSST